jgi:hypothetical protein
MITYILISVSVILLYCTVNLFLKLERSEDMILDLMDSHESLKRKLSNILENMKAIDSKGGFESDDEVGAIFDALKKEIQTLEDVYDIIENK